MSDRISIDNMMMEICEVIAKRSYCLKNKFGCVIVRSGRIISLGYNGMLTNWKNCQVPEDCPRWNIPQGTKYEIGVCEHAEKNAILFAAKNGISTDGTELYVNGTCCRICAKAIVTAGIKRVVYKEMDYDGIEILKQSGVICDKYLRD